jgi:hypothetical protein
LEILQILKNFQDYVPTLFLIHTENDDLTRLQTITSRKLSACISQREQQNHEFGQHIIEAADLDPITKMKPLKQLGEIQLNLTQIGTVAHCTS